MRIVFSAMTSKTHFYPLVPLAWACRAAGHEVRVVGSPGLTDITTAAGLTAVPVGEDVDLVGHMSAVGEDMIKYVRSLDFTDAGLQNAGWNHVLGMQTALTPNLYGLMTPDSLIDGMVDFCRSWQPDLLIWEPLTFAAPIAARVTGAAHARLLWGPDVVTKSRRAFLDLRDRQEPEHREDPFAEWVEWHLDRHGVATGRGFDEELATGQWTIDPVPASMRLDLGLPTVGMRYVDYNGPSVVPEWLHEPPARRRVALTLGVSGRDSGVEVITTDQILDAVAGIDAEFVATLDAHQLESVAHVPDNVRAVDFVPMHALLPTCDAVVHHGGPGTWHTAAIHGVPQVMMPVGWDTDLRARGTVDSGMGLAVPLAELTADRFRESVVRVLEEAEFREGAAKVRDEILSEPAPTEVVAVLEKMTAERRLPRP
ncbi:MULTISPECIES: activator-dependent family glycosyltransferase [Streptomyces]|uniref:Activator-dependent family glycosyltransferase n=3 Tax=Streptomyces TaxID=1883 RepID=A0A7H1QCV6_9ACTN|nr:MULTISPECIES: activator-dependent family glycosyltransferase [Streptomyces]MBA9050686.1 glycosyltransferase (activator-dependent family) [Streptomyces murinus]QNT98136.1 activator-dependent family glycosyltransferase [Streptomyces griseofuscus]BAC76489.1 glycosyltransferase LkmI [Streptomyces rochei]